jgi:hypothetical protein
MSIKVIATNNVHGKWTVSKESDMSKENDVTYIVFFLSKIYINKKMCYNIIIL